LEVSPPLLQIDLYLLIGSVLGAAAVTIVGVIVAFARSRKRFRALESERFHQELLSVAERAAVQALGYGVLVVEARTRILAASDTARNMLRLTVNEKTGSISTSPQLIRIMSDPDFTRGELSLRSGLKTLQQFEVRIAIPSWEGWPADAEVVAIREITHSRDLEERLRRFAYYDYLTGLANRRAFMEALSSAISDDKSGTLALLYIDLDGFKEINDSLGHTAGDEILQAVARRLRQQIRTGGRGNLACTQIARLGGDEFAIIFSGIQSPEDVINLAEQILKLIGEPLWIAEQVVTNSVSIGISMFPGDGRDLETLIRKADTALYQAKQKGRNRFEFFKTSLDTAAHRRFVIKRALGQAIERGELTLHYQPKVQLSTREVVGAEALLRWDNEELGSVGPAEFIEIAESGNLIVAIGSWVIEAACQQLRAWEDAGYVLMPIAVNVSSYQFAEPRFSDFVARVLRRHGTDPSLLEIELTESSLLDDGDVTVTCLDELRAIGLRIALDDFGTGYSALSYLTRLPLDTLKIDRTLARSIDTDPAARGITAGVISMAHSLGLTVVAEGIDREEHVGVLKELGCDQGQGFIFSAALSADDFAKLLLATDSGASRDTSREAAEPALPLGNDEQAIAEVRYALLIDDEGGSLASLALALTRVGVLGLYARDVDEALLFSKQEGGTIRAVVMEADASLERIREILETIDGDLPDGSAAVVAVGPKPGPERLAELRNGGVSWALWSPVDDDELRFVLNSALALPSEVALREGPRAPVNLVASIVLEEQSEIGKIVTLAAGGAFVEMANPPDVGGRFTLGFTLGNEQVEVESRVVYSNAREKSWSVGPVRGASVVFEGLSAEHQAQIRELVKERLARFIP
jgi:diguanylate cyclase (GGDEF)-like protein